MTPFMALYGYHPLSITSSLKEKSKVQAVEDHIENQHVIARFVGKVQELESGLETGVTGASPPTVTSMGSSFYLGGQIQGRRP
jgi:hypothetical protein